MNSFENIGRQLESEDSRLSRFMEVYWYLLVIGIACLFCKVLYHYIDKIGG